MAANPFDDLLDAAPAAQANPFDDLLDTASAPQAVSQGPSLLQAAFPASNRPKSQTPVQTPLSFGFGSSGPVGALNIRAVQDVASLPARAAGSLAGQLGYSGATGGKQGLKALADEETGLGKPVRDWSKGVMAEGMAGSADGRRGVGDYAKIVGGAVPYMAASIVEDPTTWLSLGAKPAGQAVAKTIAPLEGGFAKGSKAMAQRLVQRDYMPLKSDLKAGWSADNAIKHGLYGKDVGKLAEDGTKKLADLYQKQKALIKAGKDAGGRVDFQKAIDETLADIEKGQDSELWDKAPKLAEEYKRRISRIRDLNGAEAKDASALKAQSDKVRAALNKDVADAQLVKSDLGEDAAFASKKGTPGIDPEAAARGRFAAILYSKTKEQIEKNTPEGLREINKAMSEIIPLRNAAEYRAEVLGRQRVGKLTDFILGGSAMAMPKVGVPALVLKKFVDSPKFTKVAGKLQEFAEKMVAARSGSEASFYATKLRALGLTAAEVDAIKAASDAAQAPNAIPFRKVAEEDSMNQPQASR